MEARTRYMVLAGIVAWSMILYYALRVTDQHMDDKVIYSREHTLQSEERSQADIPVENMEYVRIPAGNYYRGSLPEEEGRYSNEGPRVEVNIESFEIMDTEVTQGMWNEVMDEEERRHGNGVEADSPVRNVSWHECRAFVERLNRLDSLHTYRLPTEAEWEYAARAETQTRFYWGDDLEETIASHYMIYSANSAGGAGPVATKIPNAWGLYDMSGNVYEWCMDIYVNEYSDCPVDGRAYLGEGTYGSNRVVRGGSWDRPARNCRSADRTSRNPEYEDSTIGFRLVRK